MSDSFSHLLQARRGYFNARFAQTQVTHPDLDGDAFLNVLRESVAPVVQAVAQANPDTMLVVGQHLYDLALDLFADGLFTGGSIVEHVWRGLLPLLAPFLIQQPQRVAASVINAAYNISQTPDARPQEWINTMRALAPLCANAGILLQAGQVAAWRAGMAQYRLGALQILKTLDVFLAHTIFGLDANSRNPDVSELHYALMANPWYDPTDGRPQTADRKRIQIVKRVGAFRGFGGTFLSPPHVTWTAQGFVAGDGTENYLVMADVFGAVLVRTEKTKTESASLPFKLSRDGTVAVNGISAKFPELANATSSAGNQNTLAVTTDLSYAICLVALV